MDELDAVIDGGASYEAAAAYMLEHSEHYTHFENLLALRPAMTRVEWLQLLGEYWTDAELVQDHLPEIRDALRDEPLPVREMMTEIELAELDAMPEWLTVYRGCLPGSD